ncbi:MAG: class I SAM-dependent methyltransferase [Nitrospiraceae bacterium]
MKSLTDAHWNERAATVKDDVEVNIMDIFQREIEYDYVCSLLKPDMKLLEVGCGNGFSTARFRPLVRHVDAFDYAENMIDRARSSVGETNNRFFVDNVLAPRSLEHRYDAVVCVRVLINLRNLAEQQAALENLDRVLTSGGVFILAEGFQEGFDALSQLRRQVGLPEVQPAKINVYSKLDELLSFFKSRYELVREFHLGGYDYLTRVVYPLIVGADNAKHNTVFSEKCSQLARAYNPDCMKALSRMRGFAFRKL